MRVTSNEPNSFQTVQVPTAKAVTVCDLTEKALQLLLNHTKVTVKMIAVLNSLWSNKTNTVHVCVCVL
jgi:hypothetical protein